jgi:hypothetical protein
MSTTDDDGVYLVAGVDIPAQCYVRALSTDREREQTGDISPAHFAWLTALVQDFQANLPGDIDRRDLFKWMTEHGKTAMKDHMPGRRLTVLTFDDNFMAGVAMGKIRNYLSRDQTESLRQDTTEVDDTVSLEALTKAMAEFLSTHPGESSS